MDQDPKLWDQLLSLPDFNDLALTVAQLIQFASLIKCVGGHFENLRKFTTAGKMDWNSFLQMWQLMVNIIENEITQIVPMIDVSPAFEVEM